MHEVLLHLPTDLYEQIQKYATRYNRSIEEVMIQALKVFFERADSRLWAIVNQRLSPIEQERLSELMDKNNSGIITDIERTELTVLVDKVNRQMLERSKALVQLQERGYDIKGYLNLRRDDDDL